MLISVDCGLRSCGVGVWSNLSHGAWTDALEVDLTRRRLLGAQLVRNPSDDPHAPRAQLWAVMAQAVTDYLDRVIDVRALLSEAGLLVIELPQVYPHRRQTDPNDLVDVAGVAGAVTSALHERAFSCVWSPVPRSWKGQIPKTVSEQRVKKFLTAHELDLVPALSRSEIHNVFDALHLGIVYMQRHERA